MKKRIVLAMLLVVVLILGSVCVLGAQGNAAATVTNGVQTEYATVQAAYDAVGSSKVIKLLRDVDETIDLSKGTGNLYIDLNGFDMAGSVTSSVAKTLNVRDVSTSDYDCEDGYGKVTSTLSGVTIKSFGSYIKVAETDGYSFHMIALTTVSNVIRVTELETNGASTYTRYSFAGDQKVKENVAAYGVAMRIGSAPDINNLQEGTYTRKTDVQDVWVTGEAFECNGVVLKGIMKTTNAYTVNKLHASTQIYSCAYVELKDGTRLASESKNFNFKALTEAADAGWHEFTYAQKQAYLSLRKTFDGVTRSWSMPELDDYLTATTYEVKSASDLRCIADNPSRNYTLMNDIDMSKETANWVPARNFSGTLSGNGYKVSNLKITTADADGNMGLLGSVTATGKVTDLNIREITINASKTTAKNIGTIAGLNYGKVTNCTAGGRVDDNRAGTADAPICVGQLVGKTGANTTVTGGTNVGHYWTLKDVNGKNQTYSTTGLCANVWLMVGSDNVKQGLVGQKGSGATVTGLWRDNYYSSNNQSQTLRNRRAYVVDYVYKCATVQWQVPSKVSYYTDASSTTRSINDQEFVVGVTYYGIPYAHNASSLEQFEYYTTLGTNGVRTLKSEIAKLNAGISDWATGGVNGDAGLLGPSLYIGSDCASALAVAWSKVAPVLVSTRDNGGVCLGQTNQNVPSPVNEWYYGFKKVGNYTVDPATMNSGIVQNDAGEDTYYGSSYGEFAGQPCYRVTTDKIAEKIGADVIYEAYALTKMGDILNCREATWGHARLAATDPVVIRDGDNKIDANKSYFVVHEQGDGLYDDDTNSSWRVNARFTFAQMANEAEDSRRHSAGVYLPITTDALNDESVGTNTTPIFNLGTTPATGNINAYFRIQYATVVVKDSAGNVKYEKTAYQGTSANFNRRRCFFGNVPMFMSDFFSDYGKNLTKGQTYTYTVTARTFGVDGVEATSKPVTFTYQ